MKSNKNWHGRFLGIALICVSLLWAGCSNPFITLTANSSEKSGNGALLITFGSDTSRSVLPGAVNLSDLSNITITLTRIGYTTITKSVTGAEALTTISVEGLAPGDWQLSVEGTLPSGSGPSFASVAQPVTVTTGSTSVTVNLKPLQIGTGYGDLNYTLSWPSARVDEVVVEWREILGGPIVSPQPFTLTTNIGSGQLSLVSSGNSIKSANYYLTIVLKKGTKNVSTVIETVGIYNSRISVKSSILSASDIAQPPVKPADLSLRGMRTPTGICLSWDDVSLTETGYRVYRKVNTTAFTDVSSLAANAESFIDTALTSGDKITYRVVAENSFGESETVDSNEVKWASELTYDESSTVVPSQIAINGGVAGVYNWDQTLTITKGTLGTIQYSTDNGTNWLTYNPATPPKMVGGNKWNFLARIDFGSGEYSQPMGDYYEIDYNRYKLVSSVSGGTDQTNSTYTSSGSNIVLSVSYTPVCGETFGILTYQQKNLFDETLLPALWTDIPLTDKSNRLDSFTGSTDKTGAYTGTITASLDPSSGKIVGGLITGGLAQRDKVFLKVAGRSYAADPGSGANSDLSAINGNIVDADSFIVLPKLDIGVLDMYNRPTVTSYLWMRKEPVVKIQVNQTDYFTKVTSAAPTGVDAYFRVQYGIKNWPYAQSATTISWQTNLTAAEFTSGGNTVLAWKDPDLSESALYKASVNAPLSVVKSDSYATASRNGGSSTLNPDSGWALYEIDNPYCTYRMGEAGHYGEISGTTGELNTRAFRTTVRFRVRAWKDGFRTSTVKKSFESDTVSPFDITSTVSLEGFAVKRLDSGSTSFTSDMPLKYRSYPIEVYEQYEGWDTLNALGTSPWYEKQGVTWYGDGLVGAKNEVGESRYKNFDYSKTKVVIFSHGWQSDGYYGLPVYTGWKPADHPDVSDYASWNATYSGQEWYSTKWRAQGYNMGYFHWNKMSMGGGTSPQAPEKKIWYPHSSSLSGAGFETMHGKDSTTSASNANAIADATRSGTIGMIFAQEVLDSLPSDYHPTELIFCGHSLGNNVISNGAQKLILRRAEDVTSVPLDRIPTRIDLLDPYWGNDNDGIYPLVSGDSVRAFSDVFHNFGKTLSARNNIGIPLQWYKTSSLTEPTMGYNDGNYLLHMKTNFEKFYFGDCDSGYLYTSWYSKRLDANLHSEAFSWFFRSIDRSQDDQATIFSTEDVSANRSSTAARPTSSFISARSRTSVLWNRLNAIRGNTSTFRWFEMNKWNAPLINRSMSTTDDWFFQWKSCADNYGDGYMDL